MSSQVSNSSIPNNHYYEQLETTVKKNDLLHLWQYLINKNNPAGSVQPVLRELKDNNFVNLQSDFQKWLYDNDIIIAITNLNLCHLHPREIPNLLSDNEIDNTLGLSPYQTNDYAKCLKNPINSYTVRTKLDKASIQKRNLNNIEIALVSSKFESIPKQIFFFSNLKNLNLRNNSIEHLSPLFTDLINLEVLNLSRNKLKTLPDYICTLPSLTTLDLSHNQLETIPNSIESLTQLVNLSINNNCLTSLPESLKNLTNLINLNVHPLLIDSESSPQTDNDKDTPLQKNDETIENSQTASQTESKQEYDSGFTRMTDAFGERFEQDNLFDKALDLIILTPVTFGLAPYFGAKIVSNYFFGWPRNTNNEISQESQEKITPTA